MSKMTEILAFGGDGTWTWVCITNYKVEINFSKFQKIKNQS